MPIYNYNCSSCNESWDEFKTIANRKEPEQIACPKCGEHTVLQGITCAAVSYTMEASKSIRKLNNASKFKEKLQQIHNETPGSNLHKQSTIVDIK